jgi:DNA-binding NtrC family response regulator
MTSGSRARTARLLGLKPNTLYSKIKKYGLQSLNHGQTRAWPDAVKRDRLP